MPRSIWLTIYVCLLSIQNSINWVATRSTMLCRRTHLRKVSHPTFFVFCLDLLLAYSVSSALGQTALNVTDSAGTSLLYVKEDGKIGIGTTSPGDLFHVFSSDKVWVQLQSNKPSNPQANLQIKTPNVQSWISVGEGSGKMLAGGNGLHVVTSQGGGDIKMMAKYSPGAVPHLAIRESGNVGIGFAYPDTYKLEVNGTIWVNGCVGCSDVRLKQNISPLGNALEKILALRGVSYDWRVAEFPEYDLSERRQIGLIAQEVEAVIPEAVSIKPTYDEMQETGEVYQTGEIYGISYGTIVPVLIEAMKEQQQIINTQKQRIDDLEARVAQIEAALQKSATTAPEQN